MGGLDPSRARVEQALTGSTKHGIVSASVVCVRCLLRLGCIAGLTGPPSAVNEHFGAPLPSPAPVLPLGSAVALRARAELRLCRFPEKKPCTRLGQVGARVEQIWVRSAQFGPIPAKFGVSSDKFRTDSRADSKAYRRIPADSTQFGAVSTGPCTVRPASATFGLRRWPLEHTARVDGQSVATLGSHCSPLVPIPCGRQIPVTSLTPRTNRPTPWRTLSCACAGVARSGRQFVCRAATSRFRVGLGWMAT